MIITKDNVALKDQQEYVNSVREVAQGRAGFTLYGNTKVKREYYCKEDGEKIAGLLMDTDGVRTKFILCFTGSGIFVLSDSESDRDYDQFREGGVQRLFELANDRAVENVLKYYSPTNSPKYKASLAARKAYNAIMGKRPTPEFCVSDYGGGLWIMGHIVNKKMTQHIPFTFTFSDGFTPDENKDDELARSEAYNAARESYLLSYKDTIHSNLMKLARNIPAAMNYLLALESQNGSDEDELAGLLDRTVRDLPEVLDIEQLIYDLIGDPDSYGFALPGYIVTTSREMDPNMII